MLKLLAAAILGLFLTTPSIENSGEVFTVSYDKGAIWACTVFRMTEATEKDVKNFPDGHYAPRKCWELDETSSSYQDDWNFIRKYDADWDVFALITYVNKDGEFRNVETNRLKVHR